ncbi:hypothetical protein RB653_000816 [Dictyostelium firmibasis]|uniref:C3H1-type domain-containing protein n=1 Tax=Dictyostelium firmibasis TaxID=79012 RepID=A0AAN7YY69_9MYCE
MKSIILIILFCNILVNGEFLNFEPFLSLECGGVPSGIGYSVSPYICINNMGGFFDIGQYDYQSWYFGISPSSSSSSSSDSNGGFAIYANSFEQENCTGSPSTTFNLGSQGQCIESPLFVTINATFDKIYNYSSSYFYVSITDGPQYTDDSIVYEVYSNENPSSSSSSSDSVCTNNNFLYASFITNGLEIDYEKPSSLKETYSCNKGAPFVDRCSSGKKCFNEHIGISCNSKVSPSDSVNIVCSK